MRRIDEPCEWCGVEDGDRYTPANEQVRENDYVNVVIVLTKNGKLDCRVFRNPQSADKLEEVIKGINQMVIVLGRVVE